MRKFFVFGLIAIFGVSTFLMSCKKENKECTCTAKDGGETYTFKEFPSNYDAKDCSSLATVLTAQEGSAVTCK
jgi:hypothetical protein